MQYYSDTQNNTYTTTNLSTLKWAQWDKTQCRELLGLFICVCIALCTIVAHNIAHNKPNHILSYPLDNHNCSSHVISCRSVTDGASLSVSKSKLVYSIWIFIDSNVKINGPTNVTTFDNRICPITMVKSLRLSMTLNSHTGHMRQSTLCLNFCQTFSYLRTGVSPTNLALIF